MAERRPGPAAGSAAALAAGLSAALIGKIARLSTRQLPDATQRAERADLLRERAVELADADAAAVVAMLTGSVPAVDRAAEGRAGSAAEPAGDLTGDSTGDATAGTAGDRADAEAPVADGAAGSGVDASADAVAVPGRIGELATELGITARQLSESGNPRLRADAIAAERLAESALAIVHEILQSNAASTRTLD